VAWVSQLARTVGAHTPIEVVRVTDLRKLVEAKNRDTTLVLQALGLAGKKAHGDWKITVFDVKREWLCRPAEEDPGSDLSGVPVCEADWQRKGIGAKARSYSGCGYLLDTMTGGRTLDTFRVDWQAASTWGFCVMPLQRFLDGA
jgi:hypothetical protein